MKEYLEERLFRSPMSDLVIKELTQSLRDDFLLFFDHVAFADNPDWSDCYCWACHFANEGMAESRREASSLIEQDRIFGELTVKETRPCLTRQCFPFPSCSGSLCTIDLSSYLSNCRSSVLESCTLASVVVFWSLRLSASARS